jgi:NitT/TauT family transport system substrate-binding protein
VVCSEVSLRISNVKNYDGSVTVVPLADPDIMTPFLKKQIDGAWVPEPMGTRLAG